MNLFNILVIELIVAICTIIIACVYSLDNSTLASLLTGYIAFSVVLVKLHITSIIDTFKIKIEENINIVFKISNALINSEGIKRKYAIKTLEDALESIRKGELKVNTDDYFRLIKENIKKSKNCQIFAICCIDELLNQSNRDQEEYLNSNIEAATKRNVTIYRKFILSDHIIEEKEPNQLDTILKQWETPNIHVGIIMKRNINTIDQTEDWVLFSQPYNQLFISITHPDDKNKIISAKQIYNDKKIEKYKHNFENLKRYEWQNDEVDNFFSMYKNKNLIVEEESNKKK